MGGEAVRCSKRPPPPTPPRHIATRYGWRGAHRAHGKCGAQHQRPFPYRRRRDDLDARQGPAARAARALARRARRDRPLGAAQARHRRAAGRRLGAARQDRGGRARRQGRAGDRADLARPRAALHRAVRLARRPRREAVEQRSGAVPSGDAGACDRGNRFRRARSGRLHRRMEMGRHPRAGVGRRTPRRRASAGFIPAPARTSPRASRT